MKVLRQAGWAALIVAGGLGSSACNSRNLHSDLYPEPEVLLREWTLPTRTFFEAGEKGAEYSNALVYENTVIFGNSTEGVVSFYPGLNQVRWRFPVPGGVISQIGLGKDRIYFAGGDGIFYCVHAASGNPLWKHPIRNPVASRPTIAQGKVIFTATDDVVYALDEVNGSSVWFYKRRSSPTSVILGASTPVVDGGDVITGLSDGYLVALNIEDGKLKWERKIHQGKKFTDVDAEPVIEDGLIYVSSYDGSLYALKRADGEIVWRYDTGSSKKVILEQGRIYLASSDGFVIALHQANAREIWKFELDSGVPTELVADGDRLYFGSSGRYFYAIDKNTGKGLYRYDVGEGSGFYSPPFLDSSKRRLYVLSAGGNLMSFSIRQALGDRKHGPRAPYAKPAWPEKTHTIF